MKAAAAEDATLLRAVIQRDRRAWHQLVARYTDGLRFAVREAAEPIHSLDETEIEDVIGDLWLLLLEDDLRRLRSFEKSRGRSDLWSWLAMLATQVACTRAHKLARSPRFVSLEALAGQESACKTSSQILGSRIATDGGSSATEEPMYEKIYGPYFKRGKHHLHLYFLDGTKKYQTFDTEEEAREFLRRNEKRVVRKPITIREAVDEYIKARIDLKESSRITMRFRLGALTKGHDETLVQAFPAHGAWKKATEENSVDTLHGIRSAANGFFKWCVKNEYLKKHPLDGVEIVGKKKRGKPQLRLDEARRFLERAFRVAAGEVIKGKRDTQQHVGVIGAAVALLMGMRNSEVVGCVVRDLDDGGKELVIEDAKTRAGCRRIEVPDVLRPQLLQLAQDKAGTDPLFPNLTKDGMRYWTARLCKEAGLPKVTPHGLRGTHATASMRANTNPHQVAAALGHSSIAVTLRHYANPEAVAEARQEAAVTTLLSKTKSKTFGQGTAQTESVSTDAA
jgi:integrase